MTQTTPSKVTPSEIISKLREIYDNAFAAGNYNAANKAAELLGKAIGLFEPSVGQRNILESEDPNDPRLAKLANLADKLTKSLQ